jgi:hypothetical protein
MLASRLTFEKGTPENLILKLALNGTYGNLINAFECLFDAMMAMKVTINGQLMLAMLAESLMLDFNVEMIQANTDGLSFRYDRKDSAAIKALVDAWEKHTKMKMEYALYDSMHIRDVNNYVAKYSAHGNGKKNGKLKLVGAYNYKVAKSGMWNKDFSNLISKRAAVKEMIDGIPVEETIKNHTDVYDFMLRGKVRNIDKLLMNGSEIMNGSRFYASTDGGVLTKHLSKTNRVSALPPMSDYLCEVVNDDYRHHDFSNIDYNFYIEQARKLVL